ncbi:MAG TPA: hypothetical protein GYA10_17140 [Alphaproteobacteria bacterium]|nr:hypothetical protein [Alphaproteobacteria bacterium]
MRPLGIGLASLMASTSLALAANVNFSGTVLAACTILASTGGTLALSTNGDTLASDNLGGLPGTVTILSIGNSTVEVAAPTRTNQPGDYNAAGETIEVAYFGTGGLALVNQAYTNQATSFGIATIPASILTVNNRITNPNGFPAGNYATQTVVTCGP